MSLTTVIIYAVLTPADNSVLVETSVICEKSYRLQIQTKMKRSTTSSFAAVNQLSLAGGLVWCCLTEAASQTSCVYFLNALFAPFAYFVSACVPARAGRAEGRRGGRAGCGRRLFQWAPICQGCALIKPAAAGRARR